MHLTGCQTHVHADSTGGVPIVSLIPTADAIDGVIAGTTNETFQRNVTYSTSRTATHQVIAQCGTGNLVNTAEGVLTDALCGLAAADGRIQRPCLARAHIDFDSHIGAVIGNARRTVTDNGVIAPPAFKFVPDTAATGIG